MLRKLVFFTLFLLGAIVLFFVLTKDKTESVDSQAKEQGTTIQSVPSIQQPKKARARKIERTEVHYDDDPVGSLRLEGQVISDDDTGVAGARVVLDSRPPRSVFTEEDGSFVFEKLVGRSYHLLARSKNGVAGPIALRLKKTTEPVILRLVAGTQVRVTVAERGGAFIENALVELRGLDRQHRQTNNQGRTSFLQVPNGRYEVVVKAQGFSLSRSRLSVSRSGAITNLSISCPLALALEVPF